MKPQKWRKSKDEGSGSLIERKQEIDKKTENSSFEKTFKNYLFSF
jgi:hypothetical protein